MIKPAKHPWCRVAGVVGLQAFATGKGWAGVVKIVDIRPNARTEAESLGAKVAGFEMPVELAVADGGYAKALPEEWLLREREAIEGAVQEADIVVLSALVPGEVAPVLITEKMVARMKPGSTIIDVSIDQGGNCALTEPGAEVVRHGVYLCGIKNIPGSVPVHSTWLYANNMYYFVEHLFSQGVGVIKGKRRDCPQFPDCLRGQDPPCGTLKALGEI